MSDTPITDAATSDCVCNSCDERDVVPRKVALELERQLAEARETIAMYRESKASLPEYSSQRELRRQLAEVTAQRDRIAKSLDTLLIGWKHLAGSVAKTDPVILEAEDSLSQIRTQ